MKGAHNAKCGFDKALAVFENVQGYAKVELLMQIAVFVEPMAGNGFRASGAEPFAFSVEGATRQEALARLRDEVQAKLRGGGEIVTLEIIPEPHPLAKYAGMFPDDELTRGWEASMAEYRRKVDEGPEIP